MSDTFFSTGPRAGTTPTGTAAGGPAGGPAGGNVSSGAPARQAEQAFARQAAAHLQVPAPLHRSHSVGAIARPAQPSVLGHGILQVATTVGLPAQDGLLHPPASPSSPTPSDITVTSDVSWGSSTSSPLVTRVSTQFSVNRRSQAVEAHAPAQQPVPSPGSPPGSFQLPAAPAALDTNRQQARRFIQIHHRVTLESDRPAQRRRFNPD